MNAYNHSSADFFEAKYKASTDPWDFESSDYELRRYDAILHMLDGSTYRSALEPGCSIGVLTEGLATICENVFALDFSPTALKEAAKRCEKLTHVQLACMSLEEIDSFAPFDLIVLSEIGYYFAEDRWRQIAEEIVAEMKSGSTLLAAHWTGTSSDHEISGDLVHEILLADPRLSLQQRERHAGFRLERWERI
jgi:cyclopropane fatty-acyl-phospholipid synthase-like methyltransferase